MPHGLDHQAACRITRDDRRACLPSFEQARARIKKETAFEFFRFGAVAFITAFGKKRPDLVFKKCDLLRGWRRLDCKEVASAEKQTKEEEPHKPGGNGEPDCACDSLIRKRGTFWS